MGVKGGQKRRLSAVMFTDIKGFSSMMESDETTAVGLVKAQREIIRKSIASHGGEERETIGDAFLVIFDSAVNAVHCAIDIQRELWDFNQTRDPDKQVWVRIGIHIGDILVEDGSIFGEGVNLAARVEPLSEPGGICITQQVYDQVRHHIQITTSKIDVRELKNISDTPTIYRLRVSSTAPREPISLKERLNWFTKSSTRILASLLILSIILGVSVYWTFFAPHKIYARQIAYIGHEPKARHHISSLKADELNHYYELTRRGFHIEKVKEVTKPSLQPEDIDEAWKFEFAKKPKRDFPIHEFSYDKGFVSEEKFLDRYGTFQHKASLSEGGKIATLHDTFGFVETIENQIAGFSFEFDHKKRISKIKNMNAFGMPRSDSMGVAMYGYRYNNKDLPIEISVFDMDGNLIEAKNGVAKTSLEYDENGFIKKETYYDRYGEIHESLDGPAIVTRSFENNGKVMIESYTNREGEKIANNDGICTNKYTYDEKGRMREVTTLGCSGNPKSARSDFATIRYEYDGNNVTNKKFFDDKDAPTTNKDGAAEVRISYDKMGRIASIAFFGPGGEKTTNTNQVHATLFYYDNFNRPLKRVFLGLDEKLTIANSGFADVRVQYNERGDATEWAYFDTQGHLINWRDGYALVKNEYDQFGNLTVRSFFDKNGEPAIGKENTCHQMTIRYDETGNLSEKQCFDKDGNLIPLTVSPELQL